MVGRSQLAAVGLRTKDIAASLVNRLGPRCVLFLGHIVALGIHYVPKQDRENRSAGPGGAGDCFVL